MLFSFHGIANPPEFNAAAAGRAVALGFSVGDHQGLGSLGLIDSGYPKSQPIACDPAALVDPTAGESVGASGRLSYKAEGERYTYAWRTNPAWIGTCRALSIRLNDGTNRVVYFSFN